MKSVFLLLVCCGIAAAATARSGFPMSSESLDYSVNWPSGLSLGEAHLKAQLGQTGSWKFEFSADASFPGFPLKDNYQASATSNFCSESLKKEITHGARHATETTTIDGRTATRKTDKGGKTEFAVAECAKDALTFVFFARKELSNGKVPPAQDVLFGAVYSLRLTYKGAVNVPAADGPPVPTDRMHLQGKGPFSEFEADIYFARDPGRTPVLVTIPSALGIFRMELVR